MSQCDYIYAGDREHCRCMYIYSGVCSSIEAHEYIAHYLILHNRLLACMGHTILNGNDMEY